MEAFCRRFGPLRIMETWFWSAAVLLLALPGPLGAGTPGNSTGSSSAGTTEGFYDSPSTGELGNLENNSTSSSGESLSPSQRSTLLSASADARAANPGTQWTQTFTETNHRPLEEIRSSTESLTSILATTTETSSSSRGRWEDSTNTDQMPAVSHAVSWEARSWMFTGEARMLGDGPVSTLRLQDASALSSQMTALTDSTYTTTISRAGERTLLSVTSSSSNSTSSAFTEDSESHQPPSTGGVPPRPAETEEYTRSAPSTRTDEGETTNQDRTSSFSRIFTESESPVWPRETQSLTEGPNATRQQHTAASEESADSTPPLRLTEPSTDQAELSVSSSTPPFTPSMGGAVNVSGTDQGSISSVQASTESSTGPHSSSTQDGTEALFPNAREDDVGLALTAGPSTVSSSTSETEDAVTERPALVTDAFLSTSPVTVTERSHMTEEDTFKAAVFTTTAATTTGTSLPLLPTSSSALSSTSSSSTAVSSTEPTVPYAARSTPGSVPTVQTSTAPPALPTSPSQTQGPSAGMATPTNATTLRAETSTGTRRLTTTQSRYVTTTSTQSTTRVADVQHTPRAQPPTELTTTPSTDVQLPKLPPSPRNPCVSNPCVNGGMCVSYKRHQFTCHCQQAWTGPTCSQDVDECEQDPCPMGSRCVNTRGSFSCECPLGYDLEDGRTCTRAKTFLGTFSVNRLPHDHSVFKTAAMHEIHREIVQLLNMSLSVLRGYSRSTLSNKEENGVHILAVNMFTISTDVTTAEVFNSIQMSLGNCSSSLTHCRMVLHHQLTYHMESLCVAQKTQCDTERSACSDSSGTAYCQCLPGYYKHNPDDLSCLECGDGYKLQNGTCVPCTFGFGGFNCGNFYKLIAVVVSPAGGGLLLILIIALIVTCCKRDKNDINKIIFKSGDLQMSPYADFPKSNRISMEWGRETIEMQENGSTKNLLQMTDIYYSPALRNADLERNGLYPFTGLPGSRHSCIYPAQWNPSFISDDSRRRDYF
ncbi:protein HEG [Salarias fasciatus]|uniref:protein HEG n=1 Tax=Salarias fasciatus TaxID=181472 RepID=UPI001176D5EC|nr:protein HEG homolog 1 [Salarias fasciatus]